MSKGTNSGNTRFHSNDFHYLNDKIENLEKLLNEKLSGMTKLFEQSITSLTLTVERANANLIESTTLAQNQIREHQKASNNLQEKMDFLSKEHEKKFERYSTTKEMNEKFGFVDEKINSLQITRAELNGKASQKSVNLTYVIILITLLISITSIIVNLAK
jgi:hypothetical protein